MKQTVFLLGLALSCSILSCSKKQDPGPQPPVNIHANDNNFVRPIPEDNGCISRAWQAIHLPGRLPSTQDSARISLLFQQNNLSSVNFVFYRFDTSTWQGLHEVAWADRYVNGVLLMEGDTRFIFNEGRYDTSNPIKEITTTLDTVPSLNVAQIRRRFIDCSHVSTYNDSCLVAQFGYIDNNPGSSSAADLSKAWEVHIAGRYYPVAYFKDDGTLISYNTGIVYALKTY